ncbi:LysM peptidoglycan-binding domain-containing protein [Candidatus Electronema sp. PJ]|uniref:LysM peptidoglycan-binding domain-containing protein n=1 Tax=Candidatus Electronema sp. PJ TaxID=3401572 RepID=UPI003AA9D46B
MKKTKKVISYIMLLVPLALPAGCSPVSTASVQGADQKKMQADDEAEQLRLIVERYFAQQEQQQKAAQPAAVQQLQAVTPQQPAQAATQESGSDEPGPALVESEAELKEELEALKKTGDWKAENVDGSQAVQCQLNTIKTAVIEGPDRPAVPLVNTPLPQPVETAAALKSVKNKVAARGVGCFPMVVNRQVQFYLNLFQGKQRRHFSRWLERSSLYMPFITAELEKAGLPLELAYLAMIESGFNPSAYSPSHASGIWQFVPSTGRNFGLRVDSVADERRDPEKSTKAAAAYLKALYRQFGDWHLAIAAYNAGEGAVERGLKRYRVNNFWDLAQQDYLRLETKRYVPQMIAAALIASSPEQYGFRSIRQLRPSQYELVRVPSGTNLKAVAASASVSVEQLRSLNNDLLKDQIPANRGGWLLKVPVGRSALVAANLPKAVQVAAAHPAVPASEYTSHKVAKNETLQQISKKYGISMTALLKVNSLRSSKLKAGQVLRVPSSSATEQIALVKSEQASGQQLAAVEEGASGEKITHKLKKGETLSDVGEKYHVQVAMLMKWNKLNKAGKVKAGQELTVYPAQEKVQVAAAVTEETSSQKDVIELTAVGTKQKPGAEAWLHQAAPQKKAGAVVVLSGSKKQKADKEKEDTVSYYKVRNGDSLWSISKKLQVSAKEIKDWNSLGDNALRPGLTLMIKNG